MKAPVLSSWVGARLYVSEYVKPKYILYKYMEPYTLVLYEPYIPLSFTCKGALTRTL